MKSGGHRSIIFAPPPARAEAEPERQVKLHQEPEEPVLVFGLMLGDVKIAQDMLQQLPFEGKDYSGSLRVVRGAAKRLMERATRLIGDNE